MKSIFRLWRLITLSLIFLAPVFNLGAQTIGCNPAVELCNPIQANSFSEVISRLAQVVVMIGLPLVVIMFIYAGSLYVFAQGSEERIKKAHQAFFWTVVGALLIVGAEAISLAIQNFARQL